MLRRQKTQNLRRSSPPQQTQPQVSEEVSALFSAAAEAVLRVGVMWDTQVKPPATHRVCQVYASALPIAYAKSTASTDWAPFACLVLRATYEATLRVAWCLAIEQKRRVRVFLTALGGGAFGNRHQWIADAIGGALGAVKDAPLDVIMVHYGSRVHGDWAAIRAR